MAKWGETVFDVLSAHKLGEDVLDLEFGTEHSACFDLRAWINDGDQLTTYTKNNVKDHITVRKDISEYFLIYPGDRVLVPTGYIFDLKAGQSLRIHPRSGLSFKNGLVIGCMEGVVDPDYVNPTYVMLLNASNVVQVIEKNMRIAQAEVVQRRNLSFRYVDEAPAQKTDRVGGVGSTGTT